MLTIKTKIGKEFKVNWVGVSTIDGVLRIELVETSSAAALTVFTNSSETEEIKYYMTDSLYDTYTGYTTFSELIIKTDGSIDIGLRRNTNG